MAPLDHDTRCPHCGSREFWPARNRGYEKLLGPVLPYFPFRCRACLRRYVVLRPWVGKVRMYAGIVLVLAAVAVLAYTFLFSSNGTTTASNQTAQEVSAPAADSQALPNTQQNSSDHSTGNTTDAVQVKAPGKEPAEPATTHSEVVVAAPETQETPLPAHTNTTKPNDKPALMSGPVFFQFYIDYPKGGNHAAQ